MLLLFYHHQSGVPFNPTNYRPVMMSAKRILPNTITALRLMPGPITTKNSRPNAISIS